MGLSSRNTILIVVLALILFTSQAHAFGAGNIASISAVEGHNWRHGDIEDLLKQVACIRHHKWNSMMIKRVYFGNWLRDYSQAMDVGALKKANAETIRVLVWLLSFLGFGYATAEFEVTSERLGVYRPEEHIDNPKNYNDDQDARPYEPRLRGPIRPIELEIDPETGMKNYIANGKGDWATSAAFVKHSFERSIHFGRQYCSGGGFLSKGNEDDLCEGLRLLGQGLHTLEDFGAHTNYVELALIELGHRNVFPLVGTQTAINLRGKHVFPLVTGTFGMVDFYHSVLGEATDHFTQSEISEMDNALGIAQSSAQSSNPLTTLIKLLSKVPGTRDLCSEAERLQAASHAQANMNMGYNRGFDGGSDRSVGDYSGSTRAGPGDYNSQQQGYQQPHQGYDYNQQHQPSWGQGQQGHDYTQQQYNQPQGHQPYSGQPPQNQGYDPGHQPQWNQQQPHDAYSQPQVQGQQTPAVPASSGAPAQTAPAQPVGLPGAPNFDPAKTVQQIYPILAFRDKVVRTISGIIEKIPGLEALVDKIVETLTVFVLSLLAPFVRPVLEAVSKSLQKGSEGVIDSSGRHQYEVWTDPRCSDPTHSMLSKDHFSNVLNEPAGLVAGEILKFIAPRVLYAWEHPDVPVQKVMQDIESIFHHPAIRNEQIEVHRNMFRVVKQWNDSLNDHGRNLDDILSMDSVKAGKNHKGGVNEHLGHGSSMGHPPHAGGQHSSNQGGLGGMLGQAQSFMGGQHQGGSSQGGLGGMFNQAQHMMGGQHGSGGSYQSHNQQGGMGGMFNQASSLYGQFSGHGSTQSHSSGGYGGSSGGGGGLNDMLNMANKLPIPGVSNFTSTLGKFSSFIPGGRTRGMDDTGSSNTRSISSDDTRGRGQSGYETQESQSDISVDPAYSIFGGSNVGGAKELRDAMSRANTKDRSPSPGPLTAPSGYEEYSGGSGQSYEGGSQYGSQYGGSTGNYYQGGAAGGEHSSYYRS